jgi:hypothetical protein
MGKKHCLAFGVVGCDIAVDVGEVILFVWRHGENLGMGLEDRSFDEQISQRNIFILGWGWKIITSWWHHLLK